MRTGRTLAALLCVPILISTGIAQVDTEATVLKHAAESVHEDSSNAAFDMEPSRLSPSWKWSASPQRAWASPAPFDVDPAYVFYMGGSSNEARAKLRADRSGHLVLVGQTTSSEDFPLYPPMPGVSTGGPVVVKLRQSDGKILFSKRLIGPSRVHDVAIGRNDDIVLFLEGNIDALLTPDARLRDETYGALVIIDCIGEISYASYVPTDGLREFVDMDVDRDGNIYLLAHTYDSPPMATPDALFRKNQGSEDGFVMKFSGTDHRLVYATCFGGDGHEEYTHIAADDSSFAIFGIIFSGSGYPLVNAMQTQLGGGYDFVVSRISRDGQRILYSTYLGGRDSETWNQGGVFYRRLRFDTKGNLYLMGETVSDDFPVTHTIAGMSQSGNSIVLCKFSHAGQLRFSARVGGTERENCSELDVDDCGNVMLTGWSRSPDFPLVQPLMQVPTSFLCVIDTRTAELRFSTALGLLENSTIVLEDSTLYMAGVAGPMASPTASLPPSAGYPGPHPMGKDFLVSALVMPALCPRSDWTGDETERAGISAELEMRDTLLIDMRRHYVHPLAFEAKLRVRNISSILSTDSIEVALILPDALLREGVASPLHFIDSPLPPGGERTYSWMLRGIPDSLRSLVSVDVRAAVNQRTYCSFAVYPSHTIFIVPSDLSYTEVSCSVDCPDSLQLRADGTRLANDVVQLDLHIGNLSDEAVPLGPIRLAFPRDAGVSAIEPPTLLRHVPPIDARGTAVLSWKLRVQSWAFDRSLQFTASIADTFDFPVQSCKTSMFIPGSHMSSCRIDAPDEVSCLPDGSSLPSPIPVMLTIENPADTTRFYSAISLDLSAAPHLQFAPGDSLMREAFYIRDGFRRVFEWRLALKPGIASHASDTVVAHYTTQSDGKSHSCRHVFALRFLNEELSCGIGAEEELHLDPATRRLARDSMLVEAVFWNSGGGVQPLSHALLQVPPEHDVTLIGDAEQPLHDLAPGARDTVRWHTVIPGFPHARGIPFTVTAHREDDTEATRCEHRLDVPSVMPFCDIMAPDTVRYDPVTGTYSPDRFYVVAQLLNPSDTALGFVRAEIDTEGMRRMRLLSTPTAERTDLLPRSSWEVRWECEPVWSDADEDETILVAFTLVTRGEVISCERVIRVEGAPIVYDLACETAGHDTVWADRFHEQLIPNPLQLQYTLKNEGRTVVPSCGVAIILPPMLTLSPGQDSIRMYPSLSPGESYDAEWEVGINDEQVTAGPWPVRWNVVCGDSVLSPGCEMQIGLSQASPAGLVVTPWLLRFEAEKGGPLPDAQQVALWTGGGTEPAWSVTAQTSWLDAAPVSGGGHVEMTVRPNTTALPIGRHTDVFVFSSTPLCTGDIRVIYDIHDVLETGNVRAPHSIAMEALYPNPVRAGDDVIIRFRAARGSAGLVLVHDFLGRRVRETEVMTDASGRGRALVSTGELRPGSYRVSICTEKGSAARLFIVVR